MPLFSERPARIELGQQVILVEADDILCVRVQGLLTGKEARWVQAAMLDYGSVFGPFDFIVDVKDLQGFDAEARKIWVHATVPYEIRAIYAVNASFGAKTLLWSIYRAGRILRPTFFGFTLETFSTEEEARALIRQRRLASTNTVVK